MVKTYRLYRVFFFVPCTLKVCFCLFEFEDNSGHRLSYFYGNVLTVVRWNILCQHWILLNSRLYGNCRLCCSNSMYRSVHVRWGHSAGGRRSTVGGRPRLWKNRLSICDAKTALCFLEQRVVFCSQSSYVWAGSLVQAYRTQSLQKNNKVHTWL